MVAASTGSPGYDRFVNDEHRADLAASFESIERTGLVRRLIEVARDEDLGPTGGLGDVTSAVTVPDDARVDAAVVVRRAARGMNGPGSIVVAGLAAVPTILEVFGGGLRFSAGAADGEPVGDRARLGVLSGRARDVLAVERTLLNVVGRLSGIATLTASYVRAVEGTAAGVFDTRKTTPGLRVLEKYAVRCGGGRSHRLGLYDALLIKDNHLAGVAIHAVADTVTTAAARARALAAQHGQVLQFIECEVDRLEQLRAILDAGGCGVGIVLLDNMSLDALRDAVSMRDRACAMIDRAAPHGGWIELEASGGVTLESIGEIARTGVDRISVGALTHQAVSIDVGLDVLE